MSKQYIEQNHALLNWISLLEKQTKFFAKKKSNFGEITLLFNPNTQEEYFMKETRFKNF